MKLSIKQNLSTYNLAIFSILIALFIPAFVKQATIIHLLVMAEIFSILVMGWVAIYRVGQFSLGQATFLGLGAYTSALLVIKCGFSFWLTIFLGGVFSAIVAFVIGIVVLRLKGLYFCIVTFAFSEIFRIVAGNWISVTGGYFGLTTPLPRLSIFNWVIDFTSKVHFYYLLLIIVVVTAFVFWKVNNSRIGKTFRAVAANPLLTQSLGINLMKYRVLAFVLAAFFAGVAGSIYSSYFALVQPELYGLMPSLKIQVHAIVGGVSSPVAGPIVGTMLMLGISEFARGIKGLEPTIYGIGMIVAVLLFPNGLVNEIKRIAVTCKAKFRLRDSKAYAIFSRNN